MKDKWKRWRTTRIRGRSRFIWLNGVLGWGVTTGVVWSVVMSAMQGWDKLPVFLPIALVGFPIGGYIWGIIVWGSTEKKFQKETGEPPVESSVN